MQKQEHGTKVNQRVRLKSDGQDSLYVAAFSGGEGWVRKQDHDSHGYPIVYIEWDKDHWTYSGEPDKWALDAHFEPVEESTVGEDKQIPEELQGLFLKLLEEYQNSQKDKVESTPAEAEGLEYKTLLAEAYEAAKEAEAFLVIAVGDGGEIDGYPAFLPMVFSNYKNEDVGAILESYLAMILAKGYYGRVADIIKTKHDEKGQQ